MKLSFYQRNADKIRIFFFILIMFVWTLPISLGYLWLVLRSFSVDMNGFMPTQLTLKNWRFLWSSMK